MCPCACIQTHITPHEICVESKFVEYHDAIIGAYKIHNNKLKPICLHACVPLLRQEHISQLCLMSARHLNGHTDVAKE